MVSGLSAFLGLPRATVLTVILAGLVGAGAAHAADGAALYAARCAVCQDHPEDRIPGRDAMARMGQQEIVAAATQGVMRGPSSGLGLDDLQAIAAYLSPQAEAAAGAASPVCTAPAGPLKLDGPAWRGWGNDHRNRRYQPDPGLTVEDVPRLKVKWVYRYDASMAVGQPVLVDGWVFAGTQSGQVIALDAETGCLRWSHKSGAATRTAISLGALPAGAPARVAAWYADDRGVAHAVDAETGAEIWSRQLDSHVAARVTGAPLFYRGRLYVPVSSAEEGWAKSPAYECCTFRGSVVALDAVTGAVIWQTYTIDEAPHPSGEADQARKFGPAGAAVWSAPTLDEKRGLLYIATGNSYTDVPEHGSDAILAIDLATGRIVWTNQVRKRDNFVVPCRRAVQAGEGNCPKDLGPDFDFGSSPVLATGADGRDVLLAGQKSGSLFALDPDREGRTIWETSVGAGSALGGIQWGFAVDDTTAFVPVADPFRREGGPAPKPGVYAVRIGDGALLWQWAAPANNCAWSGGRCLASNSAAATAIPGAVFAGASDGHLRAYRAGDGAVIWDFDTADRPYTAVNGGVAQGGSIDNGGPVVAGGMVLVNSGYGRQLAHSGNALFAFTPDGR